MKHTALVDSSSNAAQRYLTHSIFRYFGKYPPTSTRILLEKLWGLGAEGPVVDIMCGSGTTLLESSLAGRDSVGLDVNPISLLISQVKVERADADKTYRLLGGIQKFAKDRLQQTFKLEADLFTNRTKAVAIKATPHDVAAIRDAAMQNIDRWFSNEAAEQHAVLRAAIEAIPESAERRILLLAWLRTIRKSSKASSKTGRLFLDKQKTPRLPFDLFVKEYSTIQTAQAQLPEMANSVVLKCVSAVKMSSQISDMRTIFWHPPYFALYKYSSDVLRLELEWLGADRRVIAGEEIRDGFKTSNPNDAEKYLADCDLVWKEMFRASASGARGVAINSDSTLSKKKLNIFSRFAQSASDAGFKVEEILRRETSGTQALYHKSADTEIQTKHDYIVVFRKP
ncbi:MAG: hypothetical protein K8U03_26755 [Planctomycetia bacterium]|nr:hypothetical protein [Planctomycetia bacterium]